MALSSGASSRSSRETQSSGSQDADPDLQAKMEQRRKRRMESNRESAQRSRMRKQRHLEELNTQANHLRKENDQFLTLLNMTTQNCLAVDAENSVLRTQKMELQSRLYALDEILCAMNANPYAAATATASAGNIFGAVGAPASSGHGMSPWSSLMHMSQPIDLYQCF